MGFSRKRHDRSEPNFFQSLGENSCLFQPSLKNTVPGLQACFAFTYFNSWTNT